MLSFCGIALYTFFPISVFGLSSQFLKFAEILKTEDKTLQGGVLRASEKAFLSFSFLIVHFWTPSLKADDTTFQGEGCYMKQVTAKGCFSMSDHEVPRLPGILGLV